MEVVRTSIPEQPDQRPVVGEVSTEELARRQGVRPITPVEDIAALAHPDAFDSDEEFREFREFLADLYASRHAEAS